MANSFTLALGGASITGASTLVFLNPPAAPNLALCTRRFWIGQSNNMASAQQRVQLSTQVTAFPTLTSQSPAKTSFGNSASILTGGTAGAAGTCGVNASAEGAGAKTIIWPDAFNVTNGWLFVPTPDEEIDIQAGAASGLGLFLPAAPGTLTNWVFGIAWKEI